MGRMKRVKGKKAERYKANPFALVPVDKEGLKMRLERHANLMSDLLSQGKDFNSLPVTVLKTIVRDFQIAGLDVPTPALQRIQEHQQAGLKNRPAPIFLPAVTNQSRDKDLRSELISRGFNPKTGFSESGPSIPHHDPGLARAGVKLPYVPVHRYGKTNLFSDAANKTAASWLPPWMVYGDQPNQFVKTPRPMSMGHGPSFQYSNQYYQGGRTFGPHNVIQRAALSGMRPSVAVQFPIGRKMIPDTVSRLDEMGLDRNSIPEPMEPLREKKRGRPDKPSRLWANRYPVNGDSMIPAAVAAMDEAAEETEPIDRFAGRKPDAPMLLPRGQDTSPMDPMSPKKPHKKPRADVPSRLWANKYPVYSGMPEPGIGAEGQVAQLLAETGKVSPARLLRSVAASPATPVAAGAAEEEEGDDETAGGSPVRRSTRVPKPSVHWSPSTDADRVAKGLRESPLAKKAAGRKSTAKPKKAKGAKKVAGPSFSAKDWE